MSNGNGKQVLATNRVIRPQGDAHPCAQGHMPFRLEVDLVLCQRCGDDLTAPVPEPEYPRARADAESGRVRIRGFLEDAPSGVEATPLSAGQRFGS